MTKVSLVESAAERKKVLIAEGEYFRVGLVHAKLSVGHALQPQALLHGALDHAVGFAHARVDQFLAPTGVRLETVMPYAMSALSFMARRKLIKPALAVAVVVAVGVAWFKRRKRSQVRV
ncbi:MAG: hypothetical protein V4754_04865 [Pseudomonadota bacterium]